MMRIWERGKRPFLFIVAYPEAFQKVTIQSYVAAGHFSSPELDLYFCPNDMSKYLIPDQCLSQMLFNLERNVFNMLILPWGSLCLDLISWIHLCLICIINSMVSKQK